MGQILALLTEYSWRAVLDILLITTGIFFLYKTLTRLGTWKIMGGILLALIVFVLASAVNLQGVEWIYKNVSHVAVLGLIVIFQPELRKLLEKAVSVRPRSSTSLDTLYQNMIAESLMKLAAARCGAIIVFPGKELIREKISGGYQLDAIPSIPLILSIFDDSSPGHDGAIIIQGNKIIRFGVRLPMSQSTRLSEEYGTRHHAAMGLAEQTDALVLVVSEERGRVSIFHDGAMHPAFSSEEITKAIIRHQQQIGFFTGETAPRISRQNLIQFTLSLVIAIAFWSSLVISQREVVERMLPASIDYTSPSDNLALMGDKLTEVNLHLSGQKSDMDELAVNPPTVKIDLSKMAKGTQRIIITSENIRLPKGVSLLDVSPQQLKLTLTPLVEKSVKITPQIIGKLPGDLKIKKIRVVPETVLITAPSDKNGNTITEVLTTPVYLESVSEDTTLFCKIIAQPSIQPVDKRWPDVEVHIELKNSQPRVNNKD
ncbi:MAG: diadenylate cyclase [Desulfobulbus sp.]|jgi:diadenylate cyclase